MPAVSGKATSTTTSSSSVNRSGAAGMAAGKSVTGSTGNAGGGASKSSASSASKSSGTGSVASSKGPGASQAAAKASSSGAPKSTGNNGSAAKSSTTQAAKSLNASTASKLAAGSAQINRGIQSVNNSLSKQGMQTGTVKPGPMPGGTAKNTTVPKAVVGQGFISKQTQNLKGPQPGMSSPGISRPGVSPAKYSAPVGPQKPAGITKPGPMPASFSPLKAPAGIVKPGQSFTNPKGVPENVAKALAARGYNPDGSRMTEAQKMAQQYKNYQQPPGIKSPQVPNQIGKVSLPGAKQNTTSWPGQSAIPVNDPVYNAFAAPKVQNPLQYANAAPAFTRGSFVDDRNSTAYKSPDSPQVQKNFTSIGTGEATWPGQSAIPANNPVYSRIVSDNPRWPGQSAFPPNGPVFSAAPQHNVPQTAIGTGEATWPGQSALPVNNPVRTSIVQDNPRWPGQSTIPANGPVFSAPQSPQIASYGFPEFNTGTPQYQKGLDRAILEVVQNGALNPAPNTPTRQATAAPVTGITYQGRGVGDAPTSRDIAGVGNESIAPAGVQNAYTVQRGDTLSKIAAKNGTTVKAIAEANGIANPNAIKPGQTLNIPTNASIAPMGYSEPGAPNMVNSRLGIVGFSNLANENANIPGMLGTTIGTPSLDQFGNLGGEMVGSLGNRSIRQQASSTQPAAVGQSPSLQQSISPSQDGNYPNPIQDDTTPEGVRQHYNRYKYEKERLKNELVNGVKSVPSRMWDAITSGDIRNPEGRGNFPSYQSNFGTQPQITPAPGLPGQNDTLAALVQKLIASLDQQGILSSGNKSQMDLVYNTFV